MPGRRSICIDRRLPRTSPGSMYISYACSHISVLVQRHLAGSGPGFEYPIMQKKCHEVLCFRACAAGTLHRSKNRRASIRTTNSSSTNPNVCIMYVCMCACRGEKNPAPGLVPTSNHTATISPVSYCCGLQSISPFPCLWEFRTNGVLSEYLNWLKAFQHVPGET